MPDNPPGPSPPGEGPVPGDVERPRKEDFYRHLSRRVSAPLDVAKPRAAVAEKPARGSRTRVVIETKRRPLVPGRRIIVHFDRMGPEGEALATVEGRPLAVPYAAPGDEAGVRLIDVAPEQLRGQIVAIRKTSSHVVRPRCPHFGRCGGCQWQHLDYTAQLEQKTLLAQEVLARVGLGSFRVDPAIGWEPPWEFRTRLEATVSTRDGRPVLGFFTWGGERVVDIKSCPVQHTASVSALSAVRSAWDALVPAVEGARGTGPRTATTASVIGWGTLRGVLVRVGAATGEVMLGLKVSEPLTLDGRAMVVRALLDRVPGLVGIMEMRVPRKGHLIRGRRPSLLWGRAYIREEVAGVRYHIPALAEFPTNARALPGLIELILTEFDAGPNDIVIEPDAGIGAYTLHLALAAGRVLGITEEGLLDAAWENAKLNRLTNCVFYTRDPIKALGKFRRYGTARCALLHPPGTGLPRGLTGSLRRNGIRRIVYLARTLTALERDAPALVKAGFRIARIRPVDVSPQTSRFAVLLTALL